MKPLILLILTCLLPVASASAGEMLLEVDLNARELVVSVDGEELKRYPVSVGKEKNPTPMGEFKIRKVIFNPSWVPPNEKWAKGKSPKPPGHPENPMKRVKMFFREPDYYIHGTGDEDSLGKAESHGCIRMDPDDVTELARLVLEHGGKPMPDPWWKRIFRRKSTQVVMLSAPVQLQING